MRVLQLAFALAVTTSFGVAGAQDLSPTAVAAAGFKPQAADSADSNADADDDEDEDAAARRAFNAGREAFDAGDYEAALHNFERAYSLSARPELLYNVGQSADRLRRDDTAIAAFESYLRERPDAPNADAVRARLEVLRAQRDDTGAVEDEGSRGPLIGGIIGAVVAAAVLSVVLVVVLRDDGAPQHDLRVEALSASGLRW